MIQITIEETGDFIHSFSAKGHAGYAQAGSDIICAAVTALATAAIGSLEEIARISPRYVLQDGHIEIVIPTDGLSSEQLNTAAILMRSLLIGCEQIRTSYNNRYIRIKKKNTLEGLT